MAPRPASTTSTSAAAKEGDASPPALTAAACVTPPTTFNMAALLAAMERTLATTIALCEQEVATRGAQLVVLNAQLAALGMRAADMTEARERRLPEALHAAEDAVARTPRSARAQRPLQDVQAALNAADATLEQIACDRERLLDERGHVAAVQADHAAFLPRLAAAHEAAREAIAALGGEE